MFKVSLGLCILSCIRHTTASNVRFPSDDESEMNVGRVTAEERYSDSQAASVVLQPNGVKRLPHFILPQAPSAQNPFGHVNPNGFAEGLLLSQVSGRPPPNRHYKPNSKLPEKMKPVQHIPYRVQLTKPLQQHQTRKPLFAPKGPPMQKDLRPHPSVNKHKNKHHYYNKEQEYHHAVKPDSVAANDKELNKFKGNKYYVKTPHSYTESAHPYKFLPTPPPRDVNQYFDTNLQNDKTNYKEKYSYSGLSHFSQTQPTHQQLDHPKYQEQNAKQDLTNSYYSNKHFVPVQEHVEEESYPQRKDIYTSTTQHKQLPHYTNQQQNQPPPQQPSAVHSLFDYIKKWSENNNKYDNSKYNAFKELDLDEPSYDREWLSGSEWVPIHAPAPSKVNENHQQYAKYDNIFSASTSIANAHTNPSSVYSNTPSSFTNSNGQSQFSTLSFSNSLSGQSSTAPDLYSRSEYNINPYDLSSQIFQKPEVVIGKRPKSTQIVNNSHEVSAVFMVKQ